MTVRPIGGTPPRITSEKRSGLVAAALGNQASVYLLAIYHALYHFVDVIKRWRMSGIEECFVLDFRAPLFLLFCHKVMKLQKVVR